MKKIILIGAGGHCKSCIDVIEEEKKFEIVGIIDNFRKKSIFGYPSPELFYSKKYHLQGCMPDFPRPRDWGCVSCDAAFFKEKESVVDCFLEGTAEPFEDMEEVMERYQIKNGRFTDINVAY